MYSRKFLTFLKKKKFSLKIMKKHCKNCECCPVSILIFRFTMNVINLGNSTNELLSSQKYGALYVMQYFSNMASWISPGFSSSEKTQICHMAGGFLSGKKIKPRWLPHALAAWAGLDIDQVPQLLASGWGPYINKGRTVGQGVFIHDNCPFSRQSRSWTEY